MVLTPGCPCCGSGDCDTSVVVTVAGLPPLYYPAPSIPISSHYAMGVGFQKASDYNGVYRLTNTLPPGTSCRHMQEDFAVFEQQDDQWIGKLYNASTRKSIWAIGLEENTVPGASLPSIKFIWPGTRTGQWVEAFLNGGISTDVWPRGVTYTAGTDFTLNYSNPFFPTSGWTLRVDSDTGQPAINEFTNTLIPWGRPTDANCGMTSTGTISVDGAGYFGHPVPYPQFDDELELAFGTGANIRVDGGSYYTTFFTSGLTLTLKATAGYSVEYYANRSHCPLPGWFYQGSINWERRLISDNSLFSTGTDTVCQFIVMPPSVQDIFLNTSSSTTYPTFVFNPSSANGTDVPVMTAAVHAPYAARFSAGGDDCRAWATKSIGATTLNFYNSAWQASLQSPGITVTQL